MISPMPVSVPTALFPTRPPIPARFRSSSARPPTSSAWLPILPMPELNLSVKITSNAALATLLTKPFPPHLLPRLLPPKPPRLPAPRPHPRPRQLLPLLHPPLLRRREEQLLNRLPLEPLPLSSWPASSFCYKANSSQELAPILGLIQSRWLEMASSMREGWGCP